MSKEIRSDAIKRVQELFDYLGEYGGIIEPQHAEVWWNLFIGIKSEINNKKRGVIGAFKKVGHSIKFMPGFALLLESERGKINVVSVNGFICQNIHNLKDVFNIAESRNIYGVGDESLLEMRLSAFLYDIIEKGKYIAETKNTIRFESILPEIDSYDFFDNEKNICFQSGYKNLVSEEDEDEGERATTSEMYEEIIHRMKIAGICNDALNIYKMGGVPVSLPSGVLGRELNLTHMKIMERIRKYNHWFNPYFIVESHKMHQEIYVPGCDVISVLFLNSEKDLWEDERQFMKDGIYSGYAYNLDIPEWSEYGCGEFIVQNGVFIRKF